MMGSSLYDGITKIKTIHVLGMYRTNANYVTYLIKRFIEWEKYYTDIVFQYYFLENNSTDNTREILLEFVKTRKNSKLVLYNMKKDYVNFGDGTNYNRISTLSKLRNLLVDNITPLPENEWCLFIDSNIYFQDDTLSQIFKEVQPTDQNIAMISVYTQQLLIPNVHGNSVKELSLMGHFYDTYSIIDINKKSFFPKCPFEKCKICPRTQSSHKKKDKNDDHHHPRIKEENITEVFSCYGGFVLISTNALNHPNVRWETVCFDLENDKSFCEHLLFCDRLRTMTNKKIVIIQNIDKIYRTV